MKGMQTTKKMFCFITLNDLYFINSIINYKRAKYLDRDSCRNFPSKLTRSTSSLKMGANSHASLKWLSGNDRGNKANGACTNPTPGTFPDLYNVKKQQQQHQIHVLVFQLTTKHDYHWQYSIPFSYLLSFNIYWEYPSWKK